MRGPIEDPNARPHDYDRPNRSWQCGLEALGCPCSAGPTAKGSCPAVAECVPIRDGDRWVCNRTQARGGPCDGDAGAGGPTPDGQCCQVKTCRPRRTLRAIRARWLRGAVLLTIGVSLMLLGAKRRNELAKPGPLTSHHAQVLAETNTSQRCATCHPGANDSASAWISEAIVGHTTTTISQSDACLTCHQDLAEDKAAPLLAHGLSTDALPSRRQTPGEVIPVSLLEPAPRGAHDDDPVACATCHQEHYGADHDLSAMTDARCQACHEQQYPSFVNGHPDFGVWPNTRRPRIAFNHASHQSTHYAKANRSFDCAGCHAKDATGDLTARTSYQQACASCHDDSIHKSLEAGIDLIALPSIDRASLDGSHPDWPPAAQGDFDGEIPLLLRLLLASDPAANEAFSELGHDATFFDIDVEDDQSLAAGEALVNAMRRLLDELQEEGHGAIGYRIESLVGSRGAPVDEYVSRLAVELIDELQSVWFGGQPAPEEYDAIEDRQTGGGWTLDHDRLALSYRSTGHDDPMLRAWIDLVVALPEEHAELRDAVLFELRQPGTPGQCLECHSVEATPGGIAVNWRGRDRLSEPRGFTRFSHRPHLTQPQLADCTACHTIDSPVDTQPAYRSLSTNEHTSEFVSLSKAACVECHRPHAAGDSCTQCHNYHVSPRSAAKRTASQAEIERLREALSDPRQRK